jgi:importin subunit beta-1
MVVAKIARIDLLQEQWPDLLERIHQFVAPESPDSTREHALECLGFICEEHVDSTDRFPQQETNRMLTSLVQGMAVNQPDRVRLAATRALCDAIEFASFNFDKDEERNYLMQMICEVMISSDPRIRLAAYQNVNKVLELHYRYLETYISAIYGLTTNAFKDDSDDVAMQARFFAPLSSHLSAHFRRFLSSHAVALHAAGPSPLPLG